MADVVAHNQSSFFPQRQITNNIIICHEMIHSLKTKDGRRGGIIIKIDLEKAYDCLEWRFIEETLVDFGLPHNMVKVIMGCITQASFRLLWNGGCTDAINQTSGLRQGDPISTYIFVLCMEQLVHRIRREVEIGNWTWYGPGISYLFFC